MPETRRKEIADAIRKEPLSAMDLAHRFGVPVKTVLSDLDHIRRSMRRKEKFSVDEAVCTSCGFVFRKRARLNAPSRCPRCRSEMIREPLFRIVE